MGRRRITRTHGWMAAGISQGIFKYTYIIWIHDSEYYECCFGCDLQLWCGFNALNDGAWPVHQQRVISFKVSPPRNPYAFQWKSTTTCTVARVLARLILSIPQNISTRKGFNGHQCLFAVKVDYVVTACPVDYQAYHRLTAAPRTITM